MKNRIKANKKGFTLIELLAVIVVLAIIMILAVPNIIDSMNKAKKKSFQMFGIKMLNAALEQHESRALMGEAPSTHYYSDKYCYTFEDMGINEATYSGFVRVDHSSEAGKTQYFVYLTDGTYYYEAGEEKEIRNGLNGINNVTDPIAVEDKVGKALCKDKE